METIEQLYERSDYEFEQKLFQSARNGDLDFIKEFINSDIKKDYMMISSIWHMLEDACKHKQAEVVKLIFESECLITLIEKESAVERCLYDSAKSGSLGIIKYLLTENEYIAPNYLFAACREVIQHHHDIDILKYMLNHPNSKHSLKYEIIFPDILPTAAGANNLEALKYIISFPGLTKDGKSYLYEHKDKTLYFAVYNENVQIVNFLVCEMNLEKTKDVTRLLKQNRNKEIENIFKMRKLNQALNKELNNDGTNPKRLKL